MKTAYYYAKAILGALTAGLVVFKSKLGPDFQWSDIQHLPVGTWFDFAAAVLGTGLVVAWTTNGADPKEYTGLSAKVADLQASRNADTLLASPAPQPVAGPGLAAAVNPALTPARNVGDAAAGATAPSGATTAAAPADLLPLNTSGSKPAEFPPGA